MAANYRGAASPGDLAEVNWACTTADGKPLPADAQVFDQGRVRLVLGAGDFLPCLHANLAGMKQVVLFDTYHKTHNNHNQTHTHGKCRYSLITPPPLPPLRLSLYATGRQTQRRCSAIRGIRRHQSDDGARGCTQVGERETGAHARVQ